MFGRGGHIARLASSHDQALPLPVLEDEPQIIRLAVMLYIRFRLSLRNVQHPQHERGIEISHETVRYWWNRFGPMFAREIRKKRVEAMRSNRCWRWQLSPDDEREVWRWLNNSAKNTHVPFRRRERAVLQFRRTWTLE